MQVSTPTYDIRIFTHKLNKRQSSYALPLVLCHYKNLLGILGGNFVSLAFAVQGFLQGVPGQHCAFYAGGHVGDALQGGHVLKVVQLFGGDLALDHLEIEGDQAAGILDRAAFD